MRSQDLFEKPRGVADLERVLGKPSDVNTRGPVE
jgi:hypothetical protein